MFSKAKRFDPLVSGKKENTSSVNQKKQENEKPKISSKIQSAPKTSINCNLDTQSQCSSVQSTKPFVTPQPLKVARLIKPPSSLKKPLSYSKKKIENKDHDEVIKAQEVEIRNKDHTILEYNKQIEELQTKILCLQKQVKCFSKDNKDIEAINKNLSKITISNNISKGQRQKTCTINNTKQINDLKNKISELQNQCENLEEEVRSKQLELSSLEEVITIRDSLCKDLQDKLTNVEASLEEARQRLEMVKGHHALALEANESIRKEYKAELEVLKAKLEEEKQAIITKSKNDQENMKTKYNSLIESIKQQLINEKYEVVHELQQQLSTKDNEMKAKLEQIDEATQEKLRLCEIQFEERTQSLQEHCIQQQKIIQDLERETIGLKHNICVLEDQNVILRADIENFKINNNTLNKEKNNIAEEMNVLKEESKKKFIEFENEINKLTVEVDKANKEKIKFEMSLSVTRDIVQVLTMRLRESDSELEHLENELEALKNSKEVAENELTTIKKSLNNTVMECNEYKEALVNILKSKAALAKEHTRIMEHNVSLIESLQNVEKEAYRELDSIKSELIEDVELLRKESNSQIQMLREEVEKKQLLCELSREHAGQATAAAEQSRVLVSQAAAEINRLESENKRLQQQIHDQQSMVVELSLLRQENEELTMTVAKKTSIIEKLRKDSEQSQYKPKSPSVLRKTHKVGKENLNTISPLRERNH
ncbi:hypothetical protein O3G_MSEX008324 [Manduca sexta]|uniref:Uncharacterized protein n=2 Tax=Manduca sexta TaxID=7130 RepID=A0A922CPS7_MANSE|nr:hypothetical protein O3G_MSEX008324 [Manduca sexta]